MEKIGAFGEPLVEKPSRQDICAFGEECAETKPSQTICAFGEECEFKFELRTIRVRHKG